jgi:glycosyltransferase involved in cell wall biosynthesis
VRVGFDVSPLVQTQAGTARHVRGLLRALDGRPDLELWPLSYGGRGRVSTVLRDSLWYPLALGRGSERFDVLHCTTFRGPFRSRAPVVLTVHDLAVLRHPDAFRRWHRSTARAALEGVHSATAVVAVSEFTRNEVVDLLGVPAERIHVIANGVEPAFVSEGPAAEGDYVLAVGTLEPRKNLTRVVEAAARAGVELRVVGARGWGRVTVSGWTGRVDDDELARLYRGARCAVYASLYEGFGLPVLEAMASGTPVVTSAGGATEEIAGGAAILVDPTDVDAIAAGIAEAERRREELVPRGLERAACFTWERAADSLERLWRELS